MTKCPVIDKGSNCPAMSDRNKCVVSMLLNEQKEVSNCIKNQRNLYRRKKDSKLAKTNHRLWNYLFTALFVAGYFMIKQVAA